MTTRSGRTLVRVDGTDPGAPAVMASLVDLLFAYLLRTRFAEHHDDAGWVAPCSIPPWGPPCP